MAIDSEHVDEYGKQYAKIVARAWADEAFKQRFLADPAAVMREYDLSVPEGIEMRAVENTESVVYIALPPSPGEDVSDEDLALVAGGGSTVGSMGSGGTMSTASCPTSTVSTFGSAGTAGTH
jgi:hypothetical protein